jgi:hypothetical protein
VDPYPEAVHEFSPEPLCHEGKRCATNRERYGSTRGARRTTAASSPARREQASDHEISDSVQQTDFFGARIWRDAEEIDRAGNRGSDRGEQSASEHVVTGPEQASIAGCHADYIECGDGGQQSEGKNNHHLMNGMS